MITLTFRRFESKHDLLRLFQGHTLLPSQREFLRFSILSVHVHSFRRYTRSPTFDESSHKNWPELKSKSSYRMHTIPKWYTFTVVYSVTIRTGLIYMYILYGISYIIPSLLKTWNGENQISKLCTHKNYGFRQIENKTTEGSCLKPKS